MAKGGKSLADIPVAVRVLPFELPLPTTYYDIDKPFLVMMMGANGGSDPKLLQNY